MLMLRRFIHSFVLIVFVWQQVLSAVAPLDWCPEFQSASVTPYHVDTQGRAWVLVSEKTYNDGYRKPCWGDFGGKVENGELPVAAAVRELAEETNNQITCSEADLLVGFSHQIDFAKSPFGAEKVRRHTIFFRHLNNMVIPTIESGIESGPTSDGKREVAKYQWLLATDLLKLKIPAIFGEVLGLYSPNELQVESVEAATKEAHFSIPFFVLLQQQSVKQFLQTGQVPELYRKTFSQLVFEGMGFKDWRTVYDGAFDDNSAAVLARRSEILDNDPIAIQGNDDDAVNSAGIQLSLVHRPDINANEAFRIGLFRFSPNSPNYWQLDGLENLEIRKQTALKQFMQSRLTVVSHNVDSSAAVSSFPALPDTTMTDAHLRHLLGDGVDLNDTLAVMDAYKKAVKKLRPSTTEVDSITHADFVAAVEGVLKAERSRKDKLTIYHGCSAEVHFLQTIYPVLRSILGLAPRTIDWRLFDSSFRKYADVSDAFIDTAQSCIQESAYLNEFEILIAGNAALTGNPKHDGCRTLTYWKNSHSEGKFDLKNVILDVLKNLGIADSQAILLSAEFYKLFNSFYIVPENETSLKEKRKVGVLRQIFIDPNIAEQQISLSGWWFNHPIDFIDKTLPDGNVVSIYDGLENGSFIGLKNLPPVMRFMMHVRFGHSVAMEANIKKYHALVPNGLRPFNLHDFEMRLWTGARPDEVLTHYYPKVSGDLDIESQVKSKAVEIISNSLDGAKLPVRSFYAFKQEHKQLSVAIRKLGIQVAAPQVNIEEFKSGCAQGDREVIEVFLRNADACGTKFKAVDIISNEERDFCLGDYMAMVAARHQMARSVLLSVFFQYRQVLLDGISLTDTPYLLWGILSIKGLSALSYAGWQGELNLKFSAAIEGKNQTFEKRILDLDLASLMYSESNIVQSFAVASKIEEFPAEFFTNLVALGGDGLRKCLKLFSKGMNQEKFDHIKRAFKLGDKVSEKQFYGDNFDAITEIFFKIAHLRDFGEALLTVDFAKDILSKLVLYQGREAVLAKLKSFSYCMSFGLVEGEYLDKMPDQLLLAKYDVFKSAGLIDPTWHEFSCFLTNICAKNTESLNQILDLANQGFVLSNCTSFLPFASALQVGQWLAHPVLGGELKNSIHLDESINLNSNLTDEYRSRILSDRYHYLLQQENGLDKIDLKSKTAKTWFASLGANEKSEFIKLGFSNVERVAKMITVFGLSDYYIADQENGACKVKPKKAKAETVKAWFSSLDADAKAEFIKLGFGNVNQVPKMITVFCLADYYTTDTDIDYLRAKVYPDFASTESLIFSSGCQNLENDSQVIFITSLLAPYMQETFVKVMTSERAVHREWRFAKNLLAASSNSIDRTAYSAGDIVEHMGINSFLVLSASEIATHIKSHGLFEYDSMFLFKNRLNDIKSQVKALIADATAVEKNNILRTLNYCEYGDPKKEFFEFLVASDTEDDTEAAA